MYFTENSALDGTNVGKLFVDMAKFLYVKFRDQIDEARAVSYVGGKS